VQPAAPQPAQQAPPDTEIYLLPMKIGNGAITLGSPANITNNPGYDNQPFFTADSRSILFTSIRPPAAPPAGGATQAGGATETDIYRYDISTAETRQITNTPESEYSPTITPSGALSVIRVEADGTQRLWQFTADGRDPRPVLANVKPVGYHAWADDHTLALFILGAGGPGGGNGAPATLQLADTRTGTAEVLATDIGRSIQTIPGTSPPRHISFVQRERVNGKTSLVIKELDPATRAISVLTPAVEGSTEADVAWTADGTLLMAHAGMLYSWRRGQSGWKEVASLEQMGLNGVTRLAVSPRGNWLAVVAAPQTSR
jgi:WD40 repeat protein